VISGICPSTETAVWRSFCRVSLHFRAKSIFIAIAVSRDGYGFQAGKKKMTHLPRAWQVNSLNLLYFSQPKFTENPF